MSKTAILVYLSDIFVILLILFLMQNDATCFWMVEKVKEQKQKWEAGGFQWITMTVSKI